MSQAIKILVIGTVLLGCSSSGNPEPGDDPPATGGKGPSTTRTGGATGGSSPGATGGSTASATGGSGPGATGGSSGAGSGGAPANPGSGGSSGTPDASLPVSDASTPASDASTTPPAADGTPPYGCTGCTRLFDGKTLTGWDTAPGAWVVKEGGILASTGKAADIYTREDLGDYRIFFQVKHLPAMGGKDHQPCITLFGKRPADPMASARGLGGAQFQPPNGYSWDYGVGGKFTSPAGKPKLNAMAWNQCEIVVKEAGSFSAACCAVGDTPCKTAEVLSWKGPGRKHPFDFMMHNAGLFDQYREVWIERSPKEEGFLSQK